MPWSRTHKQNQSSSFRNAGYHATGTAEMRGRDVEGDDVDTLADAEYVARVHGVPERGAVTKVGLRGEEEFEGYGGGGRRVR